MSSLTVELDPVALREATTQAIMGILTPEMRAEILRQAISSLLNPSINSWEKGKSPIQMAFNRAVENIAYEIARDFVKSEPTIRDSISKMISAVSQKVLGMDQDKMAENMANAFVSSMQRER